MELKKPTVKPDMPIHANLKDLLPVLAKEATSFDKKLHESWLAWCKERQHRFPVVTKEYWDNQLINPYCFMEALFKALPEHQITVTGNGSACVVSFQAAYLKPYQRLWTNSGCATMGYDLPAAIGANKASGGQPIVCLAGDGSIMMNLQELQTIKGENLPIKIFVLNNSGYVSIFQTQRNFFNGVEVGGGPKSGVSFPNFERLSAGFDIPYVKTDSHNTMAEAIQKAMQTEGPVICEVVID